MEDGSDGSALLECFAYDTEAGVVENHASLVGGVERLPRQRGSS